MHCISTCYKEAMGITRILQPNHEIVAVLAHWNLAYAIRTKMENKISRAIDYLTSLNSCHIRDN
jgi:hypothetical protein